MEFIVVIKKSLVFDLAISESNGSKFKLPRLIEKKTVFFWFYMKPLVQKRTNPKILSLKYKKNKSIFAFKIV